MTLTFVSDAPVLKFFSTPVSAVLTIAERTSAADQLGCWPSTTAAEPARCGVAIDVPWKNAQHGGDPQNAAGIELRTFTPGAVTSGLTRKSTLVGPWLEKPARKSLVVPSWTYAGVELIVVVSPPFVAKVAPSVFETITPGIVGWPSVPSCAIASGSPKT